MSKLNIAVIFGGQSAEYDVSLKSAYAVIRHMKHDFYNLVLVGITREGEWFRYRGAYDRVADDSWHSSDGRTPAVLSPDRKTHGLLELDGSDATVTRIDAAFPVLHGRYGEDGTIQGLLELAGIPIIGCGSLASAIGMDKDIAHRIVQAAGVKVASSVTVTSSMPLEEIVAASDRLAYPLFVKPLRAGSSFGVTMAADRTQLSGAIEAAFEHDDRIIIEERIEGFEVGCAIVGTNDYIIGEIDEIELAGDYFDFTEKYTLQTTKLHMPARVDEATAGRVKRTATIVYEALRCSGFARIDLFLTPSGDLVFNEVNTIPGFTPHSRFPNMLRGIGMSFEDLIDKLIKQSIER